LIAAIAPYVGGLLEPGCTPSRYVPVLAMGGGADSVIPDGVSWGAMYGTASTWAAKAGLAGPRVLEDSGGVHCQGWSTAAGANDVRHCLFDGLAHLDWPADGESRIWQFFQPATPPTAPPPPPMQRLFTLRGWIHDAYDAFNGPSVLGDPVDDEIVAQDGRYTYQAFQKGCMAWDWSHPVNYVPINFTPHACSAFPVDTHRFSVSGWIGDAYAAHGGLAAIGAPIGPEIRFSDGTLTYQVFQNACIAWDFQAAQGRRDANYFRPMACSQIGER
jgi:hypothetical protein